MGRLDHADIVVTQRAGNWISSTILPRQGAPHGGRVGALRTFPGSIASQELFKNEGWYAAGGVWEVWTSLLAPETVPPSGHTLTLLQHMRLSL